jgi:hypothetical protein
MDDLQVKSNEMGDILLTLKGSQNGAACLFSGPVGFVIA